jgi:hypothetical protein
LNLAVRRHTCALGAGVGYFNEVLVLNFCLKCRKFVCTCVVASIAVPFGASIAGAVFGSPTADVQGDLPSDHAKPPSQPRHFALTSALHNER